MSETEVFRSRWIDCTECECVTIIERDNSQGVPDESEWDEFPSCAACGNSLGRAWNADEQTVSTYEWRRGLRAGGSRALRDAAKKLEEHGWTDDIYVGSPGWLRDLAIKVEEGSE